MNRTLGYKILYVTAIAALLTGAILLFRAYPNPWIALALVALLLIPGRIQGIAWRPFFRGRKAQKVGNWKLALSEYSLFLDRVRAKPGLKRLIWLSWGMYTRDIEAMTENNLGACHLDLGAIEKAEAHFHRALALDSSNPIPHFNLAVVKAIQGDSVASSEHAAQAKALGYNPSGLDHAIRRLGEALAAVEGRGAPTAGSKLEA